MRYFRLFYKFLFLLFHALFFLVFGLLLNFCFLFTTKKNKRFVLSWLTKIWAKSFLFILNVKVEANLEKYNPKENYLIVGNHLSWVDVLIFGSLFKSQFISKSEVSKWPLIGTLAKIGGTIFIDRKNFTSGVRIYSVLAETLKLGFSVVIFPEAKSSIGDTVLPFKPSLFLSAIESQKKVLPVTLDYGLLNGKPFSSIEDKLAFAWFGDMVFPPHIFQFLQIKSMMMKITVHDPIECNNGIEVRELTEKSYNAVYEGMESIKK